MGRMAVCGNGQHAIAGEETRCKDTLKCSRTFAARQKQNQWELLHPKTRMTLRAREKAKAQGHSKNNRLISPVGEAFSQTRKRISSHVQCLVRMRGEISPFLVFDCKNRSLRGKTVYQSPQQLLLEKARRKCQLKCEFSYGIKRLTQFPAMIQQ